MKTDQHVKRKRRVLVADDDQMVRLLTREALEDLELAVEEACDGEEALELFEKSSFDLVLLDLEMPKVDGFTACSRLRELPGGKHATIVVITGLGDYSSIKQAYALGATDFITKPINWPILSERVRYILRAQQAFAALHENESMLSEAQRIAHLGNWELDILTGKVRWSDETFRILGRAPRSATASYAAFLEAVHPQDRASVKRAHDRALKFGESYSLEHRILLPDGSEHTVQSQGTVSLDDANKPVRLQSVIQDITQRKQAEDRIHRLAYYDERTGLPNGEMFMEFTTRSLSAAQREGTKVSVIFLNLDRFKRINDSLGHTAGDRLLKAIAGRLDDCMRHSDVIASIHVDDETPYSLARLGADEFMILLRGLRRSENVGKFAQRVLESLSRPFRVDGQEIYITGSMGIALYPEDGEDEEVLLKNADVALTHAKQAGGNCFRFYASEMNDRALDRLSIESQLNRALENEELTVYFQPQLELATDKIVGFEALLRWESPERGPVSPRDFIPIAEETGLIVPIGEWVLHSVCAQLAAWQRDGLELVPVAVNLSARQFGHKDLVHTVCDALSCAGVDPQYLELEVTESIIMRDADEPGNKLRALKEIGLRLALDDFGTGYSSMSYLKKFPLDTLKIDRSFVQDLSMDASDAAIVKAVIALSKGLGLTTIAEGVETDAQRAILTGLGCDVIQGYLIGRPVPAGQIVPFLSVSRATAV
ncbi:MAG: EAL domain-containing protein [Pseudomonadota bacterium]